MAWSTKSWKNFTAYHIPKYQDNLDDIKIQLSKKNGFVDYKDIENLKSLLSLVEKERYFIVQMGECAELFDNSNEKDILSRLNLIEDFCKQLPNNITPIKIGRIAGQYSKPRSEDFELINNLKTPVYKGDMFHNFNNREFDTNRMLKAYDYSKISYEIIQKHVSDVFTSHEALNLHYEEAVTKQCDNGKYYNLSAHMLWLGEKTRFIDSAHVEYLRGIANPIGIKISHLIPIEELISIIKRINPLNEQGKIILINRMGSKNTANHLKDIVLKIKNSGLNILWMCDPMHGNTFKTKNNYKTRKLDDITTEITDFVKILKENDVKFAGIHLETSPENIYECLDETSDIISDDKYRTLCDPRLNTSQSVRIASLLSKLI